MESVFVEVAEEEADFAALPHILPERILHECSLVSDRKSKLE